MPNNPNIWPHVHVGKAIAEAIGFLAFGDNPSTKMNPISSLNGSTPSETGGLSWFYIYKRKTQQPKIWTNSNDHQKIGH